MLFIIKDICCCLYVYRVAKVFDNASKYLLLLYNYQSTAYYVPGLYELFH